MVRAGKALVSLRAFVDTPVKAGESAQLDEWRRVFKTLKTNNPSFTKELREASERLAEGRGS